MKKSLSILKGCFRHNFAGLSSGDYMLNCELVEQSKDCVQNTGTIVVTE